MFCLELAYSASIMSVRQAMLQSVARVTHVMAFSLAAVTISFLAIES